MKKGFKITLGIILILLIILVVGYLINPDFLNKKQLPSENLPDQNNSELANPASVYCEENGGNLSIRSTESGEYGVCVFSDGSECEEWMFYNQECSKGEYIPNKGMCTMEYNPVCGANGVTYGNPCQAGDIPITKQGIC